MFAFLSRLLHPPTDFRHLAESIVDNMQKGHTPSRSFWPKEFYLPTNVMDNVKKMRQWTKEDGFEYEISVIDAAGDIVSSPLFRGERTKVRATHSTRVQYNKIDSAKFQKVVEVDGVTVLKRPMKYEEYDKTRKIQTIASIHTHPSHEIEHEGGQKRTYGFFSVRDILTLLQSPNFLLGLVTDRLWFACKTSSTIRTIGQNGEQMLQRVSNASYSGVDDIRHIVNEEMKNWGLVFYTGTLNDYLKRIN
ncbi:hypothetical protein KC726_01275 [Candidatus Woesebacteria bacterium]|nr:hypothetical protein [Candidatus Woesebacteria bacterium]